MNAEQEMATGDGLGAEPANYWHEQLHPGQFRVIGETSLRDPDTGEWRVELRYSFGGVGQRHHKVGGEAATEKDAVLRMLDSLKTSIEARH